MSVLQMAHLQLLEALAAVNLSPNLNGLPGGDAAQKLINGGAAFGLLACLAAFIWGGAQAGFGKSNSNYAAADDGRSRMLKAVAGAFGIGAAAAVVNFFFNAGNGVHP